MNTKNFNKALREIKSIRMTESEKATMLTRIMSTPVVPASLQYPYPYGVWQPMFRYAQVSYYWTRRHSTSSFFAAIFAVVLIGGGLGVAAQESIPGDSLYSLKVNVMEPARQSVALSAHAKAQVATDLAGERLQEAATLAVRGDLDATKQTELQNSIEAQTAVFTSAVSDVRAHNPDLAQKDSDEFETSMDAHASSLATLARGKTFGLSVAAPAAATANVAADADVANDSPIATVATVLAIPVAVTQTVMSKAIAIPVAAASSSSQVSASKPVSGQRVTGSPLMRLSRTARNAAQSIRDLQ